MRLSLGALLCSAPLSLHAAATTAVRQWPNDLGPGPQHLSAEGSHLRSRGRAPPDGQDESVLPVDFILSTVVAGPNITIPWLPKELNSKLNDLAQNLDVHTLLIPVVLGFAVLVLLLSSMAANWHWNRKSQDKEAAPASSGCSRAAPAEEAPSPVASPHEPAKLHLWSIPGIVALTSYRFYTGFLSATWMPYLLAMEGHQLMDHRQSFFMGCAKLIYGMSILLNPIFGLLGDQMAVISHWSGRRLFVLVGVSLGGLGIYGCVVAAQIHSVGWYLAATVLWMLGEAMADVTTETLVPELLPRSQYDISSAIRALNFLLGGLAGYGALIVFRHFEYSWLYYGYFIVMLVCAFFTLCFINTDDLKSSRGGAAKQKSNAFTALLSQAYLMPMRLEGGFPKACLCLFVFSLGSAPMFFTLLMVRDVIGIKERLEMQMHFSIISIVFFVSAAIASVLGVATTGRGDAAPEDRPTSGGPEAGAGGAPAQDARQAAGREAVVLRWRLMVYSTVLFGAVAAAMPLVGFLPTIGSRTVCFYIIAVFFGLSFGSVYARFQECTWSLLPPGVDIANAMGFAAMSKLAGVGIGNFFAGFLLDLFAEDGESSYSLGGYILMNGFCAGVVLLAAHLANNVSQIALADYDRGEHRSD